jgi:hypothetical protein
VFALAAARVPPDAPKRFKIATFERQGPTDPAKFKDDVSMEFWFEYVTLARQCYLQDRPVDMNSDPMLAAMYEWLGKIDAAIEKALANGFVYFDCSLVAKRERIALRFRGADRKQFERTLRIDSRFVRQGKPLTTTDIIDLKIAIQSMILNEGRVKWPPRATKL